MTRSVTFDLPVDTSLFTPIQLQPRSAFWFAMTGWARWLREHWVPFPRLVRDHHLGVVIASLDLEYCRPFDFFDSDTLVVTAAVTVRTSGSLLFLAISVAPEHGDEIARVTAVLRPVHIGDGIALSATPVSLDPEALGCFRPEEIVHTAPVRRVRSVVSQLDAESKPMAVHRRPFTLHRHLCEAADQWSGIALSDIATEVREELIGRSSLDVPGLTAGFVEPMRRMTFEFRRAAFFLDEFEVECAAYETADELLFVHRFRSLPDGELLATFVESFAALGATTASPGTLEDSQLLQLGGHQ